MEGNVLDNGNDIFNTAGDALDRAGEFIDSAGNVLDAAGEAPDRVVDKTTEIVGAAEDIISDVEEHFSIAPGIIPVALIAIAVLLFSKPLRWIVKLVVNTVAGLVALVLISRFGDVLGVTLEFTTANALISAVFGVPGVAVLFAIQWLGL